MYRISVDTGGTFTDVVVTDQAGRFFIGKALTTPERSFTGLSAAIANAASYIGISFEALIAQTTLLVYGTTRATNAIVERKTAKTGLLVTEGFTDTLIYRFGGKYNSASITPKVLPPYVPRHLTFAVKERVNAEGGIETPLDEAALRATLGQMRAKGIEAVAVSLIWSIANPAHERRIGALIEEVMPGVPYTLSSDLNPIIREFPRTSSAAIDSSLKPLMQTHLADVRTDLIAAGFTGELLVSASSGGVMHIDDMVAKPIYMAKSGPAMAPLAGIAYTQAEGIDDDVIIVDTGGTTFDVSLIRNGTVKFTRNTWLDTPLLGTLLGMATVDIRSVGAGGGSIAWIDKGGLLRVGPESAGSVPGPACYGRGGTRPTVTDSAVALGYIDPERFLGGRMKLDRAAAEAAILPLAETLGRSVAETAAAILRLASETMIKAIEDITINDGVLPSESVVVAGGGAAGLNILSIARSMDCKSVIIPKAAGAISASGSQFSDVAIDYSGSHYGITTMHDAGAVKAHLDGLSARAARFEDELRDRGFTAFSRQLYVEARYERQQFEIELELPLDWADSAEDLATLRARFDAQSQRLYGFERPETPIEMITWRLHVVAHLPRPALNWTATEAPEALSRKVQAFFDGHGAVETTVYDGPTLPFGAEIAGPAIIEEPTTTIVVDPGMTGHLSDAGNYVFKFGAKAYA
ncbi:hydantoinase/oxoprolinase family protein [Pseudooceanicola sp. GBMRC 2024]|uniref:Hydantoinase/oxoprolinase family protein n=1 Tax=Pseudooceanicola albus TaxID=2692189 RepID=A0A6L7G1X3_9RHOB|nr:hydantoinase/oxoprolinase family protein [Pseudooceanicola albus]MXN17732.1 hydantoinase/oxoprolinase family protein [Pseudooceanicola albus]